MVDAKREWDEVTESFTGLGGRLREHYEKQSGSEPPTGKGDVEQALRTLGDALDRAFSSVGDALRDPEFREGAGQAINRLGGALATTVNEAGDEIRKRVGKMPPPDGETGRDETKRDTGAAEDV